MIVAVELLIDSGALDPEIRAQINDLAAELEQRSGELRRDTVRQCQKNNLCRFSQQFGPGFAETQLARARNMREFRKDLRDRLAGVLAGSDGGEFSVRMGEQQPNQFFARITRGADDSDGPGRHGGWE